MEPINHDQIYEMVICYFIDPETDLVRSKHIENMTPRDAARYTAGEEEIELYDIFSITAYSFRNNQIVSFR